MNDDTLKKEIVALLRRMPASKIKADELSSADKIAALIQLQADASSGATPPS